ncbi:hypothetical protein BH10PAT1_BH10PAT1_5060 [soil metagenome]
MRRSFLIVTIILFGFFLYLKIPVKAASCTMYVANNGSDTIGNGTSTSPYATINQAQSKTKAGDTVCVRAGTYLASKINISSVGTAALPIIFMKDPGTTGAVILDGTGSGLGSGQAVVLIAKAQYVTFDGFEVTNSPADGIDVDNSSNIVVSNNKIHNTQGSASSMDGSNITFTKNEVYNASLKNLNDAYGSGGWPGVVLTWTKPDGSPSTNIMFTNNFIHDSWGEGIIALYLDGALIKGNIIKDCFGVLIYSDRAKNVTIDSNYVAMTTDAHNKNGYRPDGILTAVEMSSHNNSTTPGSENVTISNNLVLGTNYGIGYWHDTQNKAQTNTYTGLHIYYNTVKDTKTFPLWLDTVTSSYPLPTQNEVKNNIFYQGSDGNKGLIGNVSGTAFSNNDWVNGIPTFDSTANGSFSSDPMFISPSSIYQPTPDGYKISNNSPVVGKGTQVAVTNDYYGNGRPVSNTDIGFYQSSSSVKIGDGNGDGKIDNVDYTIWLNHFGQTLSGVINGDFNNNGKVDGIDYILWVINFGK